MYKELPGPDLMRHVNALALLHSSQELVHVVPNAADRELLVVLRDQFTVVTSLVAMLWSGPLTDYAGSFIDYDNVPIPLCPMYYGARDLVASGQFQVPYPMSKIADRLRDALEDTPIMRESMDCLPVLRRTDLQKLKDISDKFRAQVNHRRGETLLEWRTRAHQLVGAAQAEVPKALPFLNALIYSIVSSLVSLAVWDHKLTCGEIVSCRLRHPDRTLPYGPKIPDSHILKVVPRPELMLMPLETSVRLRRQGTFGGVGIVKGASLSWNRDEDVEVGLTVVRLLAYEESTETRGSQ